MLKALQEFWGTNSTDYPAIVNEVTAGLFRELDFREEASNAARFWDAHRPLAGYLRVPRAGYARGDARGWSVTPRVHVAEWIDGEPLGAISEARQRAMVQKGLDVCFLQLFGTGFVHADPHYGNMMYDRDDKPVLLDFGLVTNLTVPQTEAMATAVTAILNEDWPTLLDSFRDIGLVPPEPAIWVDAKTGEPISGLLPGAWRRCSEDEFAASFVEALEGGGDRALAGSFTEITARLTELALTYQFILPPWLLFVVRAVITLDGFAAGMDPPLSALAAAAPHAACRVLAPRTAKGEAQLRASLFEPGSTRSTWSASRRSRRRPRRCPARTTPARSTRRASGATTRRTLPPASRRCCSRTRTAAPPARRDAEAAPLVARALRRRARGLRARRGAGAPARRRARARGAPAALLRRLPGLARGGRASRRAAAPSPTRSRATRGFEPAARTDLPPPPAWRKRRVLRVLAAHAGPPPPAAPRRVPRGPRRGLRGARGARRPRRRGGRGADGLLAVLAAAAARGAWVKARRPRDAGTPKMLKPQTRCSRKLQEYLQDLARREDLELLRAPLREHDLFPPDKDGATAAITGEELKKLVRHWKLHEARFWKMHPQKEDLVYALLEYMEDKEEYNRKGPTRPPSSKPTKEPPKVKARRQSQVDLATFRVSVLKPYGGDLFSQRDHTQGLIYLSRQNLRGGAGAGGKVQAQKSSPRNRHNSFLTGDFLGVGGGAGGKESGGGETPEEQQAAERMRERWQAIIVEIFRYSTTPGDEEHIIGEGALHVIDKIGKTEQAAASLTDLKMATYCAATLANLTTERAVHGVLMPPQQMVVAEALSLMSTHHATEPTVMLLSCLILGHLSGHYGGEDALIATCLSTLASGIAVDSATCRKVALVALANLLTSAERNQLVEHIVPAIKYLTSLAEHEAALLVLAATYNLSFFDMPRIALIEGGIIVLVSSLLYQGLLRGGKVGAGDDGTGAAGRPDGDAVLHTLAEVLLNLTCTVDGRERMIKDGAVKTLVDLEQMTTAKQSKEVIGLAVANLTGAEVSHMLPTVLAHGAVPTLVALVDYVGAVEARGRLCVALCNLSAEPANREAMIAQGSHVALKKLSDGEATTSSVQVLVLVAYINLLSVPENQCEIVEAGVLELLKRLTADPAVSPEVRRYVGMALANIADDLSRHNSPTHTDVLAMMTLLATNSGIELQRIIASAFAMFAHIMTECAYHDVLLRNSITNALQHLAESREDEVRRMCASTRPADVGLVDSVAPLRDDARRPGVDAAYAARALCNLTCEEKCVQTLLREKAIADFIAIAILRTNNEEVKGVCAECLFNLIRYERTRPKLLKEPNNVLWAISRLFRVESERTQRIGALVVYNLSCSQDTASTLMETINAAETLASVALHHGHEPKFWAAAALCNLSWTTEFSAKLVNDASAHRPQRDNEKGGRGIVKVLRSLLEADLAPKVALEVKVKCTLALYNMAMCSPEVSERLVDDGVTVLLEALLASDNPLVLELALVVCYNISLVPGCDVAMVGYQIGSSLMKLLEGLTPDDAGARACDLLIPCVTTLVETGHATDGELEQRLLDMHKLHPAWLTDEIEPMMKLLSGDHGAPKPSAARLDDAAACLYNLLTVGGTDLHAADNLSALLTALFKRVDKPQTRSLCAAALIARQGDQEGAHYSDGSVVALFSAMQSEVSGYDAAAAASPTKMKTDKRQISPGVDDDDAHGHHDTLSYFFSKVDAGTCSPSTIRSRQVDRDKIVVEPMWMHFEQDSHVVSEGLEAPPTQSLKLPKQPADPPRTMYTKSSGRFRKIILFPTRSRPRTTRTIKDDDATWGDHGSQFEIVTTFDFGQVYRPRRLASAAPLSPAKKYA
ncbi:hypothetical protein JL720_15326 [Aureococcus anophagefferens]|nr:hypothetical protein JL720_15326 [Aureococcus anophagefferens]